MDSVQGVYEAVDAKLQPPLAKYITWPGTCFLATFSSGCLASAPIAAHGGDSGECLVENDL